MSRRIDVELTSNRDDGTWTWRAAGAKQPKGEVNGSLLYEGAAIGDVCKMEAEFLLDGIEILEVFAPKKKKARTDLLEMKPREVRDDELVTEVRAPRGRGDRDRGRGDRRGKGGRRGDGERRPRGDGERRPRRERPQQEVRPKPKRLRPKRVHRAAVLEGVAEEHKPIAEQLMRGGMPAVREAIQKQNAEAKEAGTPEIPTGPVLKIAEDLAPQLKAAEWRDKADAAMADIAELDLRDLRSVVGASDAARDDEARALAEELKQKLNERIENDHQQWLNDITEAVDAGRSVRALRLSSRPVKAGAPLPPELATKLTAMASEGLASDVMQDRWATVVDAVAFSPIRNAVVPAGYPTEPSEDLLNAVRSVADRVPTIAAHFGIDPAEAAKAKRRRPAKRGARKSAPARDGDKRSERGGRSEGGRSDSGRDKDRGRNNRNDRGGRDAKPTSSIDTKPNLPRPGAQPKVEEPPADEAPADDTPVEAPATDEAVASDSLTEDTATEDITTEDTATEDTATESTATEDAGAEAPAEEPAAEATPADEAAEDAPADTAGAEADTQTAD